MHVMCCHNTCRDPFVDDGSFSPWKEGHEDQRKWEEACCHSMIAEEDMCMGVDKAYPRAIGALSHHERSNCELACHVK